MDNVCIIGCGRQGTAAAYDILLYNKPKKLLLLDISSKSLEISKLNRADDLIYESQDRTIITTICDNKSKER